MNNLDKINTHNFEEAKSRIKEFYEDQEKRSDINTVDTAGGFLWLGDHRVTGEELNIRLRSIKENFIYLNSDIKKIKDEFYQIYKALEALDEDYISYILASIESTRAISKKAEKATKTLEENQNSLNENLISIKNIQKNTILKLNDVQYKLEGYNHLDDIDEMWNIKERHIDEISKLEKENEIIKTKIEEEEKIIDGINDKVLESIESTRAISKKTEKATKTLEENQNGLNDDLISIRNIQKNTILKLNDIKYKLERYSHLDDIDEIWNIKERHIDEISKLEKENEIIKTKIEEEEKIIDGINDKVRLNDEVIKDIVDVKSNIEKIIKKNELNINCINEKIKKLFLISGGAVAIALIELLIIISRVI